MATWLLSTGCVLAPLRFAKKRCRSGWTASSLLATTYQLGFDFQPDSPLCHFNVGKDAGRREVVQLPLCCFAHVGSDRGYIYETHDAVISSCSCDDTSAVGVANEDSGAAHPPESALYHGDVLFAVIEAILGGDLLHAPPPVATESPY